MTTMSPPVLLIACIAAALMIFTRVGRICAGVVIAVGMITSALGTFVQTTRCPLNGSACVIRIMPTTAGSCVNSGRSGLLKIDGYYVLTAEANIEASVTCLDLRGLWQ